MGLFSTIKAAKYRAEGLNLMQAFRIDASLAKNDFKRTAAKAAIAFVLVGSLSFIAMQWVNSSTRAPVIIATLPQPITREAPLSQPETDLAPVDVVALEAPLIQASLTRPAVVEPPAPAAPIPAAQPEQPAAVEPVQVAMTVPERPDCIVELRQLSHNAKFYFGVGSSELTGKDLVQLSHLGRMANACPEARIQVTGHSDTTGSDLINFDLSWKRADSTMNALSGLGLDTSQFEPVGFGARTPLSEGGTTDDDRNRRVEFVVLRNELDN